MRDPGVRLSASGSPSSPRTFLPRQWPRPAFSPGSFFSVGVGGLKGLWLKGEDATCSFFNNTLLKL